MLLIHFFYQQINFLKDQYYFQYTLFCFCKPKLNYVGKFFSFMFEFDLLQYLFQKRYFYDHDFIPLVKNYNFKIDLRIKYFHSAQNFQNNHNHLFQIPFRIYSFFSHFLFSFFTQHFIHLSSFFPYIEMHSLELFKKHERRTFKLFL